MIVGVLLRHYKVYEGLFFVPLVTSFENKLSIFIGPNGVGKSSVLEALDCFFNKLPDWNINNKGKKDEAFIVPVFLIKKTDINLRDKEKTAIEVLSKYFWDVSEKANPNIRSQPQLQKFLKYRDEIKKHYDQDKYYFLVLGVEYLSQSKPFFSTFAGDVQKVLKEIGVSEKDVIAVKEKVIETYSYIYIPVESSIQNVLNLESFEMTELMSRDVLNEIEVILNKRIRVNGETRARTVSLITLINEQLNQFIEDINSTIQGIDGAYSFKIEGHYKKNLTAPDVRDIIVDKYVSIRTLKKDKKEISELSSGEQRIALIDIAYAFLANEGGHKKNIVLAIDEPEASMHMSYCFKQFKRIAELATSHNHQVIITTHWYGFIPTANEGSLHHIEMQDKPLIASFNMKTLFADRRSFPDDIELKSVFDLVGSIVSLIKSEAINWIICEGPDDQIYLEYFLKDKISNLIVLPVGGIGNVIKLYRYLYSPFSEKTEQKLLSGKVLCLVDTDPVRQEIELPCITTNKYLAIKRIQIDEKIEVTFPSLSSAGYYRNTGIEDCLMPTIFHAAVMDVVKNSIYDNIKDYFEKYYVDEKACYSLVSGDVPYLISDDAKAQRDKQVIKEFLSKHDVKYQVATNYVKISKLENEHSPIWVKEIVKFF